MLSNQNFVARVVHDCQAWGVPYCLYQLEACELAFSQLLRVSPSRAQALHVFDELVTESLNQICPGDGVIPWHWVATELDFETAVATLGNRHKAAFQALTLGGVLDQVALDLFDDRISRFAQPPV